jgi:hypothetical protein
MYLSFPAGITQLSVLVLEIHLLQSGNSAQSVTWYRNCLSQFLMMLPSESVKKFYIKVVADFLSFPTVFAMPLLDL